MDWDLIAAEDYLTGKSDRRDGRRDAELELQAKYEQSFQLLIGIIRQSVREGFDISVKQIQDIRKINTLLGIANHEDTTTF